MSPDPDTFSLPMMGLGVLLGALIVLGAWVLNEWLEWAARRGRRWVYGHDDHPKRGA